MLHAEIEIWNDDAAARHASATRVPVRETDEPRYGRTASGYGAKIPTRYQVFWRNRWRRVYVAQYGNAGTAYVGRPGAWEATVNVWHA